MDDRWIEFETRFAFQEDQLSKLEARMLEQDREILKLVQELKELREQIRSGTDPQVGSQEDEPPPPHY